MSRGGIQGFQKERLVQALAVRQLTQSQLASLVGVSAPTISKWKSGPQVPERDALERLAGVINVSPEWFTRPPSASVSLPLFRSNASAHVASRAKLRARLEWGQDIALGIGEFVDYPAVNLPTRKFQNPEEISLQEIELAACEFRDMLGLGRSAIQDLALAVEGAGVILIREDTDIAQIEGLSAWSTDLERPLILLSADKDNGYRSRFDLAHEVGHLILHRHVSRATERDRHKQMEKQAHLFAGALLLPAESFACEVPKSVTLDDMLMLKRRWGVSVAAITMRLRALGILDEEESVALFKRRSVRWGSKSEPGDDDRPPELPRLLRRSIDLLVSEKIMPLDSIPRHLGHADIDVEMLAGLPEGYFKARTNNVVPFVRLRSDQALPSEPVEKNRSTVLPFRVPPKN